MDIFSHTISTSIPSGGPNRVHDQSVNNYCVCVPPNTKQRRIVDSKHNQNILNQETRSFMTHIYTQHTMHVHIYIYIYSSAFSSYRFSCVRNKNQLELHKHFAYMLCCVFAMCFPCPVNAKRLSTFRPVFACTAMLVACILHTCSYICFLWVALFSKHSPYTHELFRGLMSAHEIYPTKTCSNQNDIVYRLPSVRFEIIFEV